MLETWITPEECCVSISLLYYILKQVPVYFSRLGEGCNGSFAMKLHNICWGPYPTFHRHRGE